MRKTSDSCLTDFFKSREVENGEEKKTCLVAETTCDPKVKRYVGMYV